MRAVIRRRACVAVLLAAITSTAVAHADDASVKPASPAPASTAPVSSAPVTEPTAASALMTSCADSAVAPRLVALLRARRFADVHHAAVSARVLCGDAALGSTRLLDAIALLRLEDRDPAFVELQGLSAQSATAQPATLVLAWAYFTDGDPDAADRVLARVPTPRAAAVRALASRDDRGAFERQLRAVPDPAQAAARLEGSRYRDARGKHPALAGVLSSILPGAGQVYAGSWQAAAVTLVLNGLFVTATVELALDKQYFTAAAAGTAASFFYVGGIMNAVDLARRRNEQGGAPHADALERLLLPELDGSFAAP
jgi:hypothetical protein